MKSYLPTFATCIFLIYSAHAWTQQENYTYRLKQSTTEIALWTTLPSEKVFLDAPIPTNNGTDIKVYCAKNEFEPAQLIIQPTASGSISIHVGDFGNGISTELYVVEYVPISQVTDQLGRTGDYPDPLWPIENNASIPVEAGKNTAIWISIYVPESVPAGDYTTNITAGNISVPISLKVFNFTLSETPSIHSQMNVSQNTILSKYSIPGTGSEYWMYVNKIKQWFIDHRLTPQSTLWPGGLASAGGAPLISYDCNGTLSDPNGIWGFEEPALRYLNGSGNMSGTFTDSFNNGHGFSSNMALVYNTNDPSSDSRPSSFCGQTRTANDWYTGNNPNSAYNTKWFQYITAIETYLKDKGYLDQSYYHIAHNPIDQNDYDAVAWYSQQLKIAAPDLKLMVTEEPKYDIYDHASYSGSKIDIWLTLLNNFDPANSNSRAINHNEETWIYFLQNTTLPYLNPVTIDHPGADAKITGWLLWKYRMRGLAYYSMNNWSQNPWTSPLSNGQNGHLSLIYPPSQDNSNIVYGSNNHRFVPSIRMELLRDGLEDYEYFRLLNNGAQPIPDLNNEADEHVNKIINGLSAYCKNSNFIYNLRRLIGLKIGGETASIPDITPFADHPRSLENPSNYFINFQDLAGEPYTTHTVDGYPYYTFEGTDYLQVGTEAYDQSKGYGWYAPNNVDWTASYLSAFSNGNELEKSVIYSNAGKKATFEFDLPSGHYSVTAGIGHQSGPYSHQYLSIEGVPFFEDASTHNSVLSTTQEVFVKDNKLTLEMGAPLNNEFTFLNALAIEANIPNTVKFINTKVELAQVHPNPFSDALKIKLSLPHMQTVSVDIVDMQGRVVECLFDGSLNAGQHSLTWHSERMPNGIYFCRICSEQMHVIKCVKK
jgi:hypothetical protein